MLAGPFECSTVIGLGIAAGVLAFWATGVPEIALLTAATVKILLPEKGEMRSRGQIVEEAAEAVI